MKIYKKLSLQTVGIIMGVMVVAALPWQQVSAKDFPSRFILWDQADAVRVCPQVCGSQPHYKKWNGQWTCSSYASCVCGCKKS